MPGFTASYDQMTAVFNGRWLKFVFDSRDNCSGCDLATVTGWCEIRMANYLTPTLCGGGRKDGRNGRWKEAE